MVLLASTRHGAEVAAKAYSGVAKAFGLSVSVQKTKFVVVGKGVSGEDQLPLSLGDGDVIERVSSFPYLGSLMAENGRVDDEVDRRIAGASRAFGALRRAVFKDYNPLRGRCIELVCCRCCCMAVNVGYPLRGM